MLKNLRKRLKKKRITNDVNSSLIIIKNNILLNVLSSLIEKTENSLLIKEKINSLSLIIIKINNILRKQRKLYIDINFELTIDNLIYYIKSEIRRIYIFLLLKKRFFS